MTVNQHPEDWLEEAIKLIRRLRTEAAKFSREGEYTPQTDETIKSAIKLLEELQRAERPQIALTQDGEVVLNWEHAGQRFKVVVDCTGAVTSYQNKESVSHQVFTQRLLAVPAD